LIIAREGLPWLCGAPMLNMLHEDLFEALPASVYTVDAEGRITSYNKAAVELWGRRPELNSEQWCGSWRLYHADGRPLPHDQCPMAVALKEGRPIRGVEAIAERPDGTRVHFEPYPTPLRDGDGKVIGAINVLVDITERKAFEGKLKVLLGEVSHRSKNLLAVTQAIAGQTKGKTVREFKSRFSERLSGLAVSHDLIVGNEWRGVSLAKLIWSQIAAFDEVRHDRISLEGPECVLLPAAAQTLGMAVHELATNAAKHGALSRPEGHIQICWSVEAPAAVNGPGGRFVMSWRERGGPSVDAAPRRGYGLEVVDDMVAYNLDARVTLAFEPAGLTWRIDVPTAMAIVGAE
jgi:PAS domain S-box-containing protein